MIEVLVAVGMMLSWDSYHSLLVQTEPVVMDRMTGFIESMFLILTELYPKYIKWAECPVESIVKPWLNFN